MKKVCFFVILLFAGTVGFGQTLDEINEMMGKLQYKQAKEGIDKYLSVPANAAKGDGWYFKGRIYNSLSIEPTIPPAEALQLKQAAFEAFQKYQQMEAKEVRMVLENYGSYSSLFAGFFDLGAKEYESKNYANSFKSFKQALEVEDYMRKKGYTFNGAKFPAIDTGLVLNLALSARLAKQDADAANYFRKLTDLNIKTEDYFGFYQYLVEYYFDTNDKANMEAMLAKGAMLYPDKPWKDIEISLEMEKVVKTEDKAAIAAKYEELLKKYPTSYALNYDYALTLYEELYGTDKRPANAKAIKTKLGELLKVAIANDKATDASMLMVNYLYNDAFDADDSSRAVKGGKPDDIKKRNEWKTTYTNTMNSLVPYAENVIKYYAAQPTLKTAQKARYKNTLDILIQVYTAKKDTAKVAAYTKQKDDIK